MVSSSWYLEPSTYSFTPVNTGNHFIFLQFMLKINLFWDFRFKICNPTPNPTGIYLVIYKK